MNEKIVSKEAQQNRNRTLTAIIVSLLFHASFLLLFTFFSHKKVETEKIVVMKVRLSEPVKVGEKNGVKNIQQKSSNKKSSPVKKEKQTSKKPDLKKDKVKEKKSDTQEKNVTKQSEAIVKKELISEDIIKKTLSDDIAKKEKEEAEFFNNGKKSNNDEALPDIGDIDSLIDGINEILNNDSGTGNGINSDQSNNIGNGIKWGDGGNRKLKYSSPIDLSDEIKDAGLKFSVVIKFNVLSDGIISSSIIIKSSGNARWDEVIRNQFSKWTFEKSSSGTATGTINIEIGY